MMPKSPIAFAMHTQRKKIQLFSGMPEFIAHYGLVIAAVGLSLLDLFVMIPGSPAIAILCLATAIFWSQAKKLRRQRWRRGARVFMAASVSCLTMLWWTTSMGSAQAQFFQGAQDFFRASFPASANGVDIVFFSLRALYILYLAVAFIGVINAVRQDEDWQTVARTPVLVVVVITLADILTTLITG